LNSRNTKLSKTPYSRETTWYW